MEVFIAIFRWLKDYNLVSEATAEFLFSLSGQCLMEGNLIPRSHKILATPFSMASSHLWLNSASHSAITKASILFSIIHHSQMVMMMIMVEKKEKFLSPFLVPNIFTFFFSRLCLLVVHNVNHFSFFRCYDAHYIYRHANDPQFSRIGLRWQQCRCVGNCLLLFLWVRVSDPSTILSWWLSNLVHAHRRRAFRDTSSSIGGGRVRDRSTTFSAPGL